MRKKLSYFIAGGLGIIVVVLQAITGGTTGSSGRQLFKSLLNITSPDDPRLMVMNIIQVLLLIIIVAIVLLASRKRGGEK